MSRRKIEIRDEEIYKLRNQGMTYKEIARYFTDKGIPITRVTIGKRCKKIYEEKGEEDPKEKEIKKRNSVTNEEIYELREQGMTYKEIAKYFNNKGIPITRVTIGERCKKIYEEKGEEEPKEEQIKKRNSVTNEEIYELREQGMTYEEIAKYFNNKGIPITRVIIGKKCKEIYKEKGKKEPKTGKRKKERNDFTNEEIYELREQGMTYEEIAKYFNNNGIPITSVTIGRRCKKIYEEKGEEDPKEKKIKKRNSVTNEEIYELREKGMKYEEIANYFNNKGIPITGVTIGKKCKKIYKEKGKEEPKVKEIKKRNSVTDEEIYKLREQGMTYEEIAKYFNNKGIPITGVTIGKKCKKIYKEKGKEEPKAKEIKKRNSVTNEEIYELREQGMTYEEIAKHFNNKGIPITRVTIGKKCKEIYKEKGKKEPKGKKGRKIISGVRDDEIYELREKGMSYGEIAKYFTKKGVKIGLYTIRLRCKKIYEGKGEEDPKEKEIKKRNSVTNEEIYELREQGMTHKEIAKYFNDKGIPITRVTIAKRCKTIYIEKGKEEPKAKKGKKERDDVTNEELYELREKGMKYEEIVKYFEKKGIKISQSQVCKRCNKIYMKKGKVGPKVKKRRKTINGVTDEEIYELREKGMSYEEIAKHFNNKGIPITGVTIRKECKEIYKEKGQEEPKTKRGRKERKDVTNEEIYELRKQGMTYGDITKYYNKKGIKINPSTIRLRCKEIYKEKGEEAPKVTRKNKKPEECLLGRLNDTLNGKIKEKMGTEQALAKLKYKEKNTEEAEK